MNLSENIKEGLRSVKANMLRSVLTALIVSIGITSLVGILTAIEGLQGSITDSLADMGVNTFDVRSKYNRGSSRSGVVAKVYPPITLKESNRFIENFNYPASVSLSTTVTGIAEVKAGSEKTNPNVWVQGANDQYVVLKGLNLSKGRNFSGPENQYGVNVAIIGQDVEKALFKEGKNPINEEIGLLGSKFRVIGVLEKKGQIGFGSSTDNSVIVPIIAANKIAGNRRLFYNMTVGITNLAELENAMGEATGLMRNIRNDKPGEEDSFDIAKSETLAETMKNITGVMRIGAFGVGFVTLLGAAVALMNIMMVSVTERTREVGVRKALGATPKRIRQQFLIEAIVVCILGGIGGVLLGIAVGNGLSRLMGATAFVVPWVWIFLGFTVCIVVGLISGYYPAYKASKLDPIESLRFE
jgi:putative ABC transport system permease protein